MKVLPFLDDAAEAWGDMLVCNVRYQEEIYLFGTESRGLDGLVCGLNGQVI